MSAERRSSRPTSFVAVAGCGSSGASAIATAVAAETAATARLPRVCISIPESEIELTAELSGSDERILRRRSASNGETTRDGVALDPELNGCGDCGRGTPKEDTFGSTGRGEPATVGTGLLGAAAPAAFV